MQNKKFFKLVEVEQSDIQDGEAFVFAWNGCQLDAVKVSQMNALEVKDEYLKPDWCLHILNGSVGVFRMESLLKKFGICRLCDGKGTREVSLLFDSNYKPTGKFETVTCCDCEGTGIREYQR